MSSRETFFLTIEKPLPYICLSLLLIALITLMLRDAELSIPDSPVYRLRERDVYQVIPGYFNREFEIFCPVEMSCYLPRINENEWPPSAQVYLLQAPPSASCTTHISEGLILDNNTIPTHELFPGEEVGVISFDATMGKAYIQAIEKPVFPEYTGFIVSRLIRGSVPMRALEPSECFENVTQSIP